MISLMTFISDAFFLAVLVGIPIWGAICRVKVYDSFITGAKSGFTLMVEIIPYFVAILVAVGMLRASGAFDLAISFLHPALSYLGVPDSILPLALLRPFSGSASLAILADIIHHYGANSFDAFFAATAMGSSETTFYVIAVYFGSVQITHTRYAVAVGLIADLVGFVAAAVVVHFFYRVLV